MMISPKKKKNMIVSILLAASMLTFASCGDDDDDVVVVPAAPAPSEEQDQQGQFTATFRPVNPTIANSISSVNSIRLDGDQVFVNMNVSGVPGNVTHRQAVHLGSTCPTTQDDLNNDGYVDGIEAVRKAGDILVPLDGNLSSQDEGQSVYPRSNENGDYSYSETASLSRLIADLRDADRSEDDNLIKLSPTDDLNLGQRVVMIYGVSDTVDLPPTVAGLPGLTPNQALPLACATLTRLSPDSEATGGATESTGETTGGAGETTGGSGETDGSDPGAVPATTDGSNPEPVPGTTSGSNG